MSYSAQLLPDEHGVSALRKLFLSVIADGMPAPVFTRNEIDAIHELYAKMTADMRRYGRG